MTKQMQNYDKTRATLHHVQQHKDNLKDVDNLLALDRVGRHRIILTPNPHGRPSEIGFQGYLPI